MWTFDGRDQGACDRGTGTPPPRHFPLLGSQLDNMSQRPPHCVLEWGPGTEFSAQRSVKAEKWVSSDPAHLRAGVSPLSHAKTQRTRGRTRGPGRR